MPHIHICQTCNKEFEHVRKVRKYCSYECCHIPADKEPLTAGRLREMLSYDPETGLFTWLVKRGAQDIGSLAGKPRPSGRHIQIRVNKVLYQAHCLAWLYMLGSWPESEIDHINRDKTDNRWENLRAATKQENAYNKAPRGRTSRFKGVYRSKQGRWVAGITFNKKSKSLGYYDSELEAALAYNKAARELHGEFAYLNPIEDLNEK